MPEIVHRLCPLSEGQEQQARRLLHALRHPDPKGALQPPDGGVGGAFEVLLDVDVSKHEKNVNHRMVLVQDYFGTSAV